MINFANRSVYFSFFLILLIILLLGSFAESEDADFSFNSLEDQITDFEARLMLARILSYKKNTLDESFSNYQKLLEEYPDDGQLLSEFIEILTKNKDKSDKDWSYYSFLQKKYPDNLKIKLLEIRRMEPHLAPKKVAEIIKDGIQDPEVAIEIAELEASFGHYESVKNLYQNIILPYKSDFETKLKFADKMHLWGDFYQIETIYKDCLKENPNDIDIYLNLARTLVSSQRYEEAEEMYKDLLIQGKDENKVLLGLAKMKVLEKDFLSALDYISQLETQTETTLEIELLKADCLFFLGKLIESCDLYSHVNNSCNIYYDVEAREALLGLAKCYDSLDDLRAKYTYGEYLRWRYDLSSKEAEIYSDKQYESTAYIAPWKANIWLPNDLSSLAEYFLRRASYSNAISCYESALETDPNYFPAQLGLAEALAAEHKYDDSIKLLENLSSKFIDCYKIDITLARVFAWSKQYDKSIKLYKIIYERNPDNPVPIREMARTAIWAKKYELSMQLYSSLYANPVDDKLEEEFQKYYPYVEAQDLIVIFKKNADIDNLPYSRYEKFINIFEQEKTLLNNKVRTDMELLINSLLAEYKMQKRAYLESLAKSFIWNKKYTRSILTYNELIEFEPGNEEAIFDQAQNYCSIGLCAQEDNIYKNLLKIDANHSLARIASERQKKRSKTSIQMNGSYWREEGRGELADILRRRADLVVDFPINCQNRLRISSKRWEEHTHYDRRTYGADGFSLELHSIINQYIKGEISWTHKGYENSELDNKYLGHCILIFNLYDYGTIGFGFERAEVLYNYFGLKKGLEANHWWSHFHSDITRKLSFDAKIEQIDYCDHNDGLYLSSALGYAITDHPKMVKLSIKGDYRDTDEENLFVYSAGNLVDIIHPYWTPRNYTYTGMTLEWNHDISKLFFCGNESRFYNLSTTVGTDSENNPAIQFGAEWHFEFTDNWTIDIKGIIHRSYEWDAEGLWASLKYRF